MTQTCCPNKDCMRKVPASNHTACLLCGCKDVSCIQMWIYFHLVFLALCSSLPLLFLASLSEHCLLFLISGGDREPPVGSHRIVRTWVMYSAPVACFHFRAASFLLAGYTNCSISILRQAVTGSWGFNGHRMPPLPVCIVRLSKLNVQFAQRACFCIFLGMTDHIICLFWCHVPFALHSFSDNQFSSQHSITTGTRPLRANGVFLWMTSYHDNHVPQWRSSTEIPAAWWGFLMMRNKA